MNNPVVEETVGADLPAVLTPDDLRCCSGYASAPCSTQFSGASYPGCGA